VSWLACSGWFTHISGHPSAAGRAQDSESTTDKDRRSTTGPRNQPCHSTEGNSHYHTLTKLLFSTYCKVLVWYHNVAQPAVVDAVLMVQRAAPP